MTGVDLADFLLARIAEDEERVKAFAASDQFPRGMAVRKHFRIQLAECDAKRRIVEEHSPVDPCDAHDAAFETIPCDTLRLLALPYADHPDYREEWRP